MAQIIIVLLSLISFILILLGGLMVRLYKDKNDSWLKLHHIIEILGTVIGIAATVISFITSPNAWIFIVITLLLSSLIIGPFNMKYRENYQILQRIHLILGYLAAISLIIMLISYQF